MTTQVKFGGKWLDVDDVHRVVKAAGYARLAKALDAEGYQREQPRASQFIDSRGHITMRFTWKKTVSDCPMVVRLIIDAEARIV